MKADQNELLTRIGPGTPCGAVLRSYWQPVALVDEFDPALDPRMAQRPLKAVRILGQDLVLFRDAQGAVHAWEDRCPHRGTRFSIGRIHEGKVVCAYHAWEFQPSGQCTFIPARPSTSPPPRYARAAMRPRSNTASPGSAWVPRRRTCCLSPSMPTPA